MKHASIERRLNTRLVGGIALYLALFTALLGVLLVRGLTRDFDEALVARAEGIIEVARQEIAGSEAVVPSFDGLDLGHFVLLLSDGTVIGENGALSTLDVAVDRPLSDAPHFANLLLPDGHRGRKVEIDFVPRGESGHELRPSQIEIGSPRRTATLVVAASRQTLDRQILRIALLLLGAWITLVATLAILVRSASRNALAPVIGLKRQVERLGPEGNVHRVSLRDPPDELAPVLRGINELLQSRERSRQDESPSSDIARAS